MTLRTTCAHVLRPLAAMHKGVWIAALCAATISWTGAAGATPGGASVQESVGSAQQYKAAMDDKRWPQAHEISKRLTQQTPTDALAWYRRARAAAFAEQWDDAAQALAQAKSLDATLAFSQEPWRVNTLEALIAKNLQPATPLGTASAAQDQSPPVAVPASAPETALAPAPTTVASAPVPIPEVPIPSAVDHRATSPITGDDAGFTGTQVLAIFGVLLVALLGSIYTAFGMRSEIRQARREFSDFLSKVNQLQAEGSHLNAMADVFEGMTRVQKELFALQKLLSARGLADTAIFEAIEGLQPVLDRNIGLAPLHELELRGMNANEISQAEVTRRMLQLKRTGRYTVVVPAMAE